MTHIKAFTFTMEVMAQNAFHPLFSSASLRAEQPPGTCPQRRSRGQHSLLLLQQIFLLAQTLNWDPKHLYRLAHPNGYPMVFNKHGKARGGKICWNREPFLLEEKSQELIPMHWVVALCVWIHCSWHFKDPFLQLWKYIQYFQKI